MDIQEALKTYIDELLAIELELRKWSRIEDLPVFLQQRYEYFLTEVFGREYLFMVLIDSEEVPLNRLKKHIQVVRKELAYSGEVVFVSSIMSNYGRQSFIKEKIQFIVPGMQLYIPTLGIAFREHVEERYTGSINQGNKDTLESPRRLSLTPSAQAVWFELIINGSQGRTQRDIAAKIGLSPIAVSRGLDLLEEFKITKTEKKGVKKCHAFLHNGRLLWEDTRAHLIDSVDRVVYVEKCSFDRVRTADIVESGETALARISMLAAPKTASYAIYKKDWAELEKKIRIMPAIAEDTVKLELWLHPVPLLDGKIHPIALCLSLRNIADERIESILEDILEEYPWDSIRSTNEGIIVD